MNGNYTGEKSENILLVSCMSVLGAVCGWIGPLWGAALMFSLGVGLVALWGRDEPKKSDGSDGKTDWPPETSPINIDWGRYRQMIGDAWGQGDYALARSWLQKFAYDLERHKAPDEVHAGFKELMSKFAKEDPLFSSVMSAVMPVIKRQPGIVQSVLSKQLSQFDKDEFRYAMYYAEVMGKVRREKKGRSYALFLVQ